ncbi:branched-chain amino acid exporter BrnF [Yaniella flava]|uniref:Branched-chain amino acid exporter BrnF n=1 Tax=Yaniella flava TaxID=287930 RepID=A0ABN2UAK9_9MICC|nr:AzlC family ABC transporter permease [Micrococcaceae bacterium]
MNTGSTTGTAPPNRRREIITGLKLGIGPGLGLFPLGIALGLLAIQSGLPAWAVPGLSIVGYAGSLEFLMIDMMTATTGLVTIAVTTFFVNFRHVFYAFSFPLHVIKNPIAKFYSMHALIDEAYAVTAAHPTGWTAARLLSMQISMHCYWVVGGLVGVVIAWSIPGTIAGLDFALLALFITLTLDAVRTREQLPSLAIATIAFFAAMFITPDQIIFAGMIIFMALLTIRYFTSRRKGGLYGPADG